MVDVLTGGRLRFGIGRGYVAREVETLGGPLLDDAANRELFEEQVEIMLKAWHEPEFAHAGAAYRVPADVPHMFDDLVDITLVPRPAHLPVEVWQPITSSKQRGFDYMARHGIKGVIAGGTAPGGQAEQGAALYRDALARAGRETELGEGLAVGFQMHLGGQPRSRAAGSHSMGRGASQGAGAAGPLSAVERCPGAGHGPG